VRRLFLVALAGVVLSGAAPAKRTFTGVVTDSMCANKAGHSAMRMGPTDAECTRACVDVHGAQYVLYDGTHVYTLSDIKAADRFAGQKVRVTGTLDAKTSTIQVASITATK
jgi:hypothetical protein